MRFLQDFRDTFFQADPFLPFGPFEKRPADKFELQVFAENWSVGSFSRCCVLMFICMYILGIVFVVY